MKTVTIDLENWYSLNNYWNKNMTGGYCPRLQSKEGKCCLGFCLDQLCELGEYISLVSLPDQVYINCSRSRIGSSPNINYFLNKGEIHFRNSDLSLSAAKINDCSYYSLNKKMMMLIGLFQKAGIRLRFVVKKWIVITETTNQKYTRK